MPKHINFKSGIDEPRTEIIHCRATVKCKENILKIGATIGKTSEADIIQWLVNVHLGNSQELQEPVLQPTQAQQAQLKKVVIKEVHASPLCEYEGKTYRIAGVQWGVSYFKASRCKFETGDTHFFHSFTEHLGEQCVVLIAGHIRIS